MENLLERIKERIAQKNSPIKTIKGVVDAIGMTESGFYRMIQRNTTKQRTLLTIAQVLEVELSYLTDSTDFDTSKAGSNGHDGSFGDETLLRIVAEMQEMKVVLEEQLRAKDRQIDKLLELLGKPEGAIVEPLYTGLSFEELLSPNKRVTQAPLHKTPFFLTQSVAKLVAPRCV